MDYEVTTLDIGPTTIGQDFHELVDTSRAIKEKIDKIEENKERLEVENLILKEFISQMTTPLRQENEAFIPLSSLPQESVDSLEAMRVTSQATKRWVKNTSKQVEQFLERCVRTYDKSIMLVTKIHQVGENWEDFQNVEDKVIPYLKALKEISM